MKEDTRKRITDLILEELSEKIKQDEFLRQKLEPFADLPIEKVADAILKQFVYLLSSDLRDLIVHLIEQEVAAEKAVYAEPPAEIIIPSVPPKPVEEVVIEIPEVVQKEIEPEIIPGPESVIEHFAMKDHFPVEKMDIHLTPNDWFYLYAFSYAPESTGRGNPTKKLSLKGVDGSNDIFLLDYGDVRFYLNKLTVNDYSSDRSGKPILSRAQATRFKFEHENILNIFRSVDIVVPFPCWTIFQSYQKIINIIEDKYVELLRSLIDIHDAVDWDVEVYALDKYITNLPEFVAVEKSRAPQRETRHQVSKGKDIKVLEKLIMKEKTLAQDIHSHLLSIANKAKIDFMIRLDNAFMDDWKSILSVRYNVGKEKRKNFSQALLSLQKEHERYQLMFKVTNPNVRFSFSS